MKRLAEIKKKKTINDLLDKKFNQLDKIVGGIACSVPSKPPVVTGGCSARKGGCKGTC